MEMMPYIRSLGFTQMLTNGAEGYRANGPFDPSAPTAFPFNDWINNGQKGVPTPAPMTDRALCRLRLVGPALLHVMILGLLPIRTKDCSASSDASFMGAGILFHSKL